MFYVIFPCWKMLKNWNNFYYLFLLFSHNDLLFHLYPHKCTCIFVLKRCNRRSIQKSESIEFIKACIKYIWHHMYQLPPPSLYLSPPPSLYLPPPSPCVPELWTERGRRTVIYLSIHLSICLSIYLSIYLSIHLSVCLSIRVYNACVSIAISYNPPTTWTSVIYMYNM